MHFDGWQTMEGRYLVYAYATVAIIQLAYLAHITIQWLKITKSENPSSLKG